MQKPAKWQYVTKSNTKIQLYGQIYLMSNSKKKETGKQILYKSIGKQILYKSMTFFCIPFIVLYLLSHVKIVVCICMYSILNKILFTLKKKVSQYLFLNK